MLTQTILDRSSPFPANMVAGIVHSRALLSEAKSSVLRANQHRMICQTFICCRRNICIQGIQFR